jgi:mono/diheme cytochrome c family protein
MTPFIHNTSSAVTYDAGLVTFVTTNDEPVRASAPGIVSDLAFIEHSHLTHSDLFLVTVRPNESSAFFMEYRNVKNLKVAEGDTVAAGQVLGGAGDYFAAPVGLVSFGVRRAQEVTQRLCPTSFTAPVLRDAYQAGLAVSNAAWPSHAYADLCSTASLLCTTGNCSLPSDFVPAAGDIDEGRRIFKSSCASCHGALGEGGIGPEVCFGQGCSCKDCVDHGTLAASIGLDMPPEGYCDPKCAADVAAFILHEFARP